MSKGVKRVLGVVAAAVVPFVAPAMAGAIGISSALGTAALGAGLGVAAAGLSGGNPLLGAALGGLGTFAASGGFQNMFGGPGATSTTAVSGPMSSSPRPIARPAGLGGAAPAVTSAAPAVAGGVTTGVTTGAATGGLGGFFQRVGQGILNNPAGVAQLAMTVFGRPPQDLTPAEVANLDELKELAETNRELFEQRVRGANEMIQMAAQQAPNPQQAFAETKIATERQLAEQTRGLGADEAALAQRRAAIRGTQTGATAAAAEEERGRRTQTGLLQQGYGMLPDEAPQGAAGLSMPIWQSLQDRRDQYYRDLARASGDLFGGIA